MDNVNILSQAEQEKLKKSALESTEEIRKAITKNVREIENGKRLETKDTKEKEQENEMEL